MTSITNPIGFNTNDSTLTFILKARDAFELLTERMASMESVLTAQRNETNEGLFALRNEITELRHLVNAKFNGDQHAQNLLRSAAQTLPNNDVENLLTLPVCSPTVQIEKPIETHLTEPEEQQEVYEESIDERLSDGKPSDEGQTETTPTPTEPEDLTNEDFKDVETDFIIDSKAHLSARRPRDQEVVVETPSMFSNTALSEIGDRSDNEDTESQISVSQSEVTVDLPIKYDYDSEDIDLDETPIHHTNTVFRETTPLVEEEVVEPIVEETRSCSSCELPLVKCQCVTDEEEDDLVAVFQRNKISSNTDLSSETNTFISAPSSPLPPFYSANTSEVSEQNVSVSQDKPSESKAVEETIGQAAEESVEETITQTADKTIRSEKSQSREFSPNTSSFGGNSDVPPKPIFGRPMFGSIHKTFNSVAAENPTFLKKLNPNENPFVVDPSKNKIFCSPSNSNSDKPSTSSTMSPKSLNAAIASSKLSGLVPGVTGEESEIIWLETRCRIYQFFKKDDIRERGVGKLRLLEDPMNSTLRCVMRREQVQKVCANFKITPKFTVATNNTGKQILTWSCLDFSDPEKTAGEPTTFICKFENEETANLFKKLTQTYAGN